MTFRTYNSRSVSLPSSSPSDQLAVRRKRTLSIWVEALNWLRFGLGGIAVAFGAVLVVAKLQHWTDACQLLLGALGVLFGIGAYLSNVAHWRKDKEHKALQGTEAAKAVASATATADEARADAARAHARATSALAEATEAGVRAVELEKRLPPDRSLTSDQVAVLADRLRPFKGQAVAIFCPTEAEPMNLAREIERALSEPDVGWLVRVVSGSEDAKQVSGMRIDLLSPAPARDFAAAMALADALVSVGLVATRPAPPPSAGYMFILPTGPTSGPRGFVLLVGRKSDQDAAIATAQASAAAASAHAKEVAARFAPRVLTTKQGWALSDKLRAFGVKRVNLLTITGDEHNEIGQLGSAIFGALSGAGWQVGPYVGPPPPGGTGVLVEFMGSSLKSPRPPADIAADRAAANALVEGLRAAAIDVTGPGEMPGFVINFQMPSAPRLLKDATIKVTIAKKE